jgi:hypothetical protein
MLPEMGSSFLLYGELLGVVIVHTTKTIKWPAFIKAYFVRKSDIFNLFVNNGYKLAIPSLIGVLELKPASIES